MYTIYSIFATTPPAYNAEYLAESGQEEYIMQT